MQTETHFGVARVTRATTMARNLARLLRSLEQVVRQQKRVNSHCVRRCVAAKVRIVRLTRRTASECIAAGGAVRVVAPEQ